MPQKTPMLKEGWIVMVVVRSPEPWDQPPIVGEIQSMDDRGLRVTAIDWLIGEFVGMDFWFPWDRIAWMEVATDAHTPKQGHFGKAQERIAAKGWPCMQKTESA